MTTMYVAAVVGTGTSMATPYACGSLALWVQSRKELGTLGTGKDVLNAARSSFINTALPVKYDDQFVQPVVRVGAGMKGALTVTTTYLHI
jgi:hypothetical protein